MTNNYIVIKRSGKRPSERFSNNKLQNSVLAACLSVRTPEGEAESIAKTVSSEVVAWLGSHPEVTSEDLRRKATQTLAIHHPEAAYLYKHHRVVL